MPSDLVALAAPQVSAIANNLNEVLGKNKVRAGFVDMLSKKPVFLESLEPEGRREPRLTGIIPGRGKPISVLPPRSWDLIAGYGDLKESIEGDLLHPLFEPEKYRGLAANSLLLYGLPGCGKSLIGRMIAEKAQLPHQIVTPSDLTSMWLGEGVSKIRQLFDWALKHAPCLLIIDELDAVAPRRQEVNMHSDEKRQVSELLTQFDRIADKRVVVVATTNYLQGIDMAIQRSGRFDLKVPVFPPTKKDREEIFRYYLTSPPIDGLDGIVSIDVQELACFTPLFSPADINGVVQSAARRAVHEGAKTQTPTLTPNMLHETIKAYPRSIKPDAAQTWLDEVTQEISRDDARIEPLQRDIDLVRAELPAKTSGALGQAAEFLRELWDSNV